MIEGVAAYLLDIGAEIKEDELVFDGNWHNLPVVYGSSFKGYYIAYRSPLKERVTFKNFKTHLSKTFKKELENSLNGDEIAALLKAEEENTQRLDKELLEHYQLQSKLLTEEWEALDTTQQSPSYLDRKKVHAFGVRFRISRIDAKAFDVIIPMRDINGKIWNLQTIDPNGVKNFRATTTKELMHVIGTPSYDAPIYICEGYSTGASIHEATGHPVVVAFSAEKLMDVAILFRRKFPRHEKLAIAGDNDRFKEENTGRNAAKAASQKVNARCVLPRFKNHDTKPTDFNDLLNLEGKGALKKQLTGAALEDKNKANWNRLDALFQEEGDDLEETWLVPNRLVEAGISLLSGPPKGGKSTLARNLVASVLDGRDWLGEKTEQGKVLVYSLEEDRKHYLSNLKLLGIKPENMKNCMISYTCSSVTKEALAQVEQEISSFCPSLVILDTLFKVIQVENSNDYQQTIKALRPLEELAKEMGTHILALHHSGKGKGNDKSVSNSTNGSVGIPAAFHTCFNIEKRKDNGKTTYTIMSEGRGHVQIDPPQKLIWDNRTGVCSLSEIESKQAVKETALLTFLAENAPESFSLRALSDATGISRAVIKEKLHWLVKSSRVSSSPGERRGDVVYHINPNFHQEAVPMDDKPSPY